VKSCSGRRRIEGLDVGFNWIKKPETNRAASPKWAKISTSSQALSRHEPLPSRNVSSLV